MDANTYLPVWAPQAGQTIKSTFAIGANSSVQVRPAALDGGGFAIQNLPMKIAVRVISATGYATFAVGSSAVAAGASDAPILQSDGWVPMVLRPGESHIDAFGVTAGGDFWVWFQGTK